MAATFANRNSDAHLKTVDFLDVILYLKNATYHPFIKPNNTPFYVQELSNHPHAVTKNIPDDDLNPILWKTE